MKILKLRHFEDRNNSFWPWINDENSKEVIEKNKLLKTAYCNETPFLMIEAKPFSEKMLDEMTNRPENMYSGDMLEWIKTAACN